MDKSDHPVNALLLHVKKGGNLASFRELLSAAEEAASQASRPVPKLDFPLPPTSRFKVASGVNFDTVKTDLDKIFKDLEKCDHKAGKVRFWRGKERMKERKKERKLLKHRRLLLETLDNDVKKKIFQKSLFTFLPVGLSHCG